MHSIHACTLYMHSIHACTLYTHALYTRMHSIHACTLYTHALYTRMHSIYSLLRVHAQYCTAKWRLSVPVFLEDPGVQLAPAHHSVEKTNIRYITDFSLKSMHIPLLHVHYTRHGYPSSHTSCPGGPVGPVSPGNPLRPCILIRAHPK